MYLNLTLLSHDEHSCSAISEATFDISVSIAIIKYSYSADLNSDCGRLINTAKADDRT